MRWLMASLLAAVVCSGCDTQRDNLALQSNQVDSSSSDNTVTLATPAQGVQDARVVQKPTVSPHAAHVAKPVSQAVVVLQQVGESGVHGVVRFNKVANGIQVSGTIENLEPGLHGFHVHEFGDLTDTRKGESAGGHFNPHGTDHGRPEDEERHVGDFGNIEADASGNAVVDFVDPKISFEGPSSILGYSLVVHAAEDKFTQPSGDAGPRVAFGVIGVAKDENK